jgi:hypothetical protein
MMEQGLSFGSYRFDVETGQLWSGTRETHAEGRRRPDDAGEARRATGLEG